MKLQVLKSYFINICTCDFKVPLSQIVAACFFYVKNFIRAFNKLYFIFKITLSIAHILAILESYNNASVIKITEIRSNMIEKLENDPRYSEMQLHIGYLFFNYITAKYPSNIPTSLASHYVYLIQILSTKLSTLFLS